MNRSFVVCGALAAWLGLAAAAAPRGHAQPSASEVALARVQFRQGVQAAREERWEDARVALQRSFELAPRPLTLLNLAGALVQTGHLVEGAEAYRRFLREVHSGRAARQRDAAQEALHEVEPRIAFLRIRVRRAAPGDVVAVDGQEVPDAALEVDYPVDPGERTIEVMRDGGSVLRRTVTLSEGEHRILELRPPRARPRVASRGGRGARRGGGGAGWLASPWLWVAVGAVVAGGVTAVVVLSSGGEQAPFAGNVAPGTWRVR